MPRNRPGPELARPIALLAVLVLLPGALRLWLLWESRADVPDLAAGTLWQMLRVGLRLDAAIAAALALPAALLLLLPRGAGERAARAWGVLAVALVALIQIAELGFFRYYGFRANYLVLEHAADAEVLRTLARGYATPGWAALALGAVAAGLGMHLGLERRLSLATSIPDAPRRRWILLALLAGFALLVRGTLDHRPLNPAAAVIGPDRLVNEITGSGAYNVAYALGEQLRGVRVGLAHVQALPPRAEAHARARKLLGRAGPFATGSANPFARRVSYPVPPGPPLNVVVVVMESFTGRLVGSLGGELALSPELDALARDGLLLTRCYATGERTVQGLEAVLASFPPLPGVSAVRRAEAQNGFATLATLLGGRGYDTLFLYGGQGIFDQMRSFFLGNGFRAFIEESDFRSPAFRGSWGVSDEDLFRRANREFQQRWEQGRPFFAALLTVSLHSPWEFPEGRAPELPPGTAVPAGFEREELANFLYADFALGEFMREARALGYARDTLFVFVGDHGVHLRGRALLPADEYRVPALFLAPGRIGSGRLDEVTSQLDIAPTILGVVGGEFESPFFGRDVRARDRDPGLAIMVYGKRHYGARRAERLTVMLAGGGREAYRVDGASTPIPTALEPAYDEDADDALALLAVAEELLEQRRYTIARVPDALRALP